MPAYVALESTVIAHGLPYPQNVETALRLESIVRTAGAEPRTIGLVEGRVVVGLIEVQILRLAQAEDVRKVSLRDLPVATAWGRHGATTVAATMWLAHRHGIGVLATGGIGGVHRGGIDVSADLEALAHLPMTVVCSGAKAILDLPATREALETRGVADLFAKDVDTYALFGGEDYELLFTLPEDELEKLDPESFVAIGLMTEADKEVRVQMPEGDVVPLEFKGYQHFDDDSEVDIG